MILITFALLTLSLSGCSSLQEKYLHDPSISLGRKIDIALYPADSQRIKDKKEEISYAKEHKKLEKEVNKGIPKKDWFISTNFDLKEALKQKEKQAKEAKKEKEQKAKRIAYLKSHPKASALVRAKKARFQKCFLLSIGAQTAADDRDFGMNPTKAYFQVLDYTAIDISSSPFRERDITKTQAKSVVNAVYFNEQFQLMSPRQISDAILYYCENPRIRKWKPIK